MKKSVVIFLLIAAFGALFGSGNAARSQPADQAANSLPEGCPQERSKSLFTAQNKGTNLIPQRGEIQLEGHVERVENDVLVLKTSSFVLPNGRGATLKVTKSKRVQLQGAAIFPQGDALWRLRVADIATGYRAIVVGRDAGSGKPLPARALAIVREERDTGLALDFFVSQKGSDAGDGSARNPFRSIQKAILAIPNGTVEAPRVLHIGPGQFAESFDGQNGQLRVANKKFLVVSGSGARPEGTQITTGNFAKRQTGVLWISDAQEVRFCNLIIGEDRAWDNKEAFFEATVFVRGNSRASFEAVHILGPSRETTLEAESRRAPTALKTFDSRSEARLFNVLVTGHGAFLSNPEGPVSSRNVSFARMFGLNMDDQFLFLQTPHGEPRNVRLFTFKDCLFYELQGSQNEGGKALLAMGDDGEDKIWWDKSEQSGGGNFVTRLAFEKPRKFYQANQFETAFGKRNNRITLSNGVWENNDTQSKATGALTVCNDLQLAESEGFPLAAPALQSGWFGGFANNGE